MKTNLRYNNRSFATTSIFIFALFLPFIFIFKEKLIRVPLDTFDLYFESSMQANPPNLGHIVRQSEDFVVPNVVHYIQVGSHSVNFLWYICLLSLIANHRPDLIIIHCDCHTLTGKYWDRLVKQSPVPIQVKPLTVPKHVFGKPIAHIWHAGDVMRQRILLKSGGIYLDNDVFVLNSLNTYRRYEFALGWPQGELIGSQVLIGEKNATFLRLYYDSYHEYDGSKWYYNAGELPTRKYLEQNPQMVHAESQKFGVSWPDVMYILYNESRSLEQMRKDYFTVHLNGRTRTQLVNDGIDEFNEENVQLYQRTFGTMARSVLFS